MTDRPQARYAIYFVPPRGGALDRFGSRWLGRDAWTGRPVEQPAVAGMDAARLAALTASPRRYGFHATLKAPFALRDGETEATLTEALTAFARDRRAVSAGRLRLSSLDGFLALTPAGPAPAVAALADACVEAFQPLARPLSEADRERRGAGLTARQRAHLARWNYPYIFEDFRFHLTLTERLGDADRKVLEAALRERLLPVLDAPVEVDALALFLEEEPGAPFRIVARFPLIAGAAPSY